MFTGKYCSDSGEFPQSVMALHSPPLPIKTKIPLFHGVLPIPTENIPRENIPAKLPSEFFNASQCDWQNSQHLVLKGSPLCSSKSVEISHWPLASLDKHCLSLEQDQASNTCVCRHTVQDNYEKAFLILLRVQTNCAPGTERWAGETTYSWCCT